MQGGVFIWHAWRYFSQGKGLFLQQGRKIAIKWPLFAHVYEPLERAVFYSGLSGLSLVWFFLRIVGSKQLTKMEERRKVDSFLNLASFLPMKLGLSANLMPSGTILKTGQKSPIYIFVNK